MKQTVDELGYKQSERSLEGNFCGLTQPLYALESDNDEENGKQTSFTQSRGSVWASHCPLLFPRTQSLTPQATMWVRPCDFLVLFEGIPFH